MRPNPYTPGAGFMPAYLAGRETLIENAEEYLRSIKARYPQQSVVYYGLRGVGKTVLLNQIEMSADNLGILCTHIEAVEGVKGSKESRFTNQLVSAINKFLFELNSKTDTVITKNYADDLTEFMVQLGKCALHADEAICFFIDDVQYLSKRELGELIVAIHRCNQLRLPVMAFCAGLPEILKTAGESSPYAERLFRFELVC